MKKFVRSEGRDTSNKSSNAALITTSQGRNPRQPDDNDNDNDDDDAGLSWEIFDFSGSIA